MLNRLKATVQKAQQALTGKASVPPDFRTLTVPSYVQARVDNGGLVLVNIRKGLIFQANPMGARIWQGLAAREGPATLNELATEYHLSREQVVSNTAQFVSDLVKHGLLICQ
jgi:hypothetical protein